MRKLTNITDASNNRVIIILNFAALERNVAIDYTHFDMVLQLNIHYCMVYASVREDNSRALASGLSPVQVRRLYNN